MKIHFKKDLLAIWPNNEISNFPFTANIQKVKKENPCIFPEIWSLLSSHKEVYVGKRAGLGLGVGLGRLSW